MSYDGGKMMNNFKKINKLFAIPLARHQDNNDNIRRVKK